MWTLTLEMPFGEASVLHVELLSNYCNKGDNQMAGDEDSLLDTTPFCIFSYLRIKQEMRSRCLDLSAVNVSTGDGKTPILEVLTTLGFVF